MAPGSGLSSWSLDYSSIPSSSTSITQRASSSALTLDPPGYIKAESHSLSSKRSHKTTAAVRSVPSPADVESLKQKKAWDVAMAPAKSVPMNAFMLYMSGTGVQIFSMMVVGMLLTNPIKAILSIKSAFAPYITPGQPMAILPQQALFIACQLACMGLGIYKCWSMGLLPTESSDWLAWREARVPLEFSPVYP
ncbi:hypothetical protein CBS101457_001073 [Exobasidium rhododendri]|nr:hypothetical protein CBS101457_001073 [Exobasidium rhododendri]